MRPETPNSYHLRPGTPGTPGTFATEGRPYSSAGSYGMGLSESGSHEMLKYYDNQGQFGGRPGSGGPNPDGSEDASTYYFNKEGGRAAAGGAGAAAAAAARAPGRGGFWGWVKRRPLVASLIALAIVAAIAVGVALGVVLGNKSDATKNGSSASPDNNAAQGSTGSNGGVASNGTSTSTNGSTTAKAVTPLPAWNLTDPNTKMIGVSLGNWLVLERWMDEDWMTSTGGDDAWDEWTFTQNLGADKAKAALTDHWNSWVTEAEIDTLKSVGINTVRIPVGYWAFVPAASGEPYVAQAGQTDQITKMLGWLYDRGMYAMIDLHGMPGSQNGDQSSGHNTTNQQWWSDTNQGYSYTVLNATIEFIKTNKYSSVVHSVCSVNEPQIYSDSNKKAIATKWYEASYNMLKAAGLIFVFHNGFGQPDDWVDFATGKDPNYIAYSTNPYPGWFPAKTNADSITSAVCTLAQQAVGYPVPMIYTEWSVVNGVQTDSFDQSYYNTQLSAYGWSAGSSFWSFKTVHSTNRVLAETNNVMDMYSLLTLISQGLVQKPSNPNESGLDMLKGLNNTGCGDIPTVKWTNPSTSGSSSRRRSLDDGASMRMRTKRAL